MSAVRWRSVTPANRFTASAQSTLLGGVATGQISMYIAVVVSWRVPLMVTSGGLSLHAGNAQTTPTTNALVIIDRDVIVLRRLVARDRRDSADHDDRARNDVPVLVPARW